MASVSELAPLVGVTAACDVVGVARASFYRHERRRVPVGTVAVVGTEPGGVGDVVPGASLRHEGAAGERSELILPPVVTAQGVEVPPPAPPTSQSHPRALSPAEQQAVLEVLHSPRFQDAAPATVFATLLDERVYLASERTMYRLLAASGETRSRRDQLVHPTYAKPELLATAPNQVWSWDITKLLGPATWTYFSLYVILDIYSRYVVGWMVAHREHAELAERLIAETIAKQAVPAGQLTLHADRGSSMTSKPVAFLLADLGVTKTHSRPHVSNDNPYSEAQFKTLKYRPGFPDRFASIEQARAFCQDFFRWYNAEHRHSGIGLMAPEVVHHGQAQAAYNARPQVLATAYAAHPERFVRQAPRPPQLPTAAWINPPLPTIDAPTASEEVSQ
ncbi:MAG: IS3 family transposase [Chloroflexi bacterium]|nr:IS3 family transposase [Chloroflexota bacterium]